MAAFKLRPDYQVPLQDGIFHAWECGHRNVLAVMPTGGGKTTVFCSIANIKALAPVLNLRLPTAIMVHRKELVQQICLTLAQVGITHNIIAPRNVIQGIVAAQRQVLRRQFYDYNAPITVISVDTLNARIKHHEKWAKSIKLWITDEAAHLLRDNKWGKAVSYFENAIGLGVTATPQRLDRRGLGRHADGVFDVMVEGPTSRWLIDNGYLCTYRPVIPSSDYTLFLKRKTGDADYTKEEMLVAAQQSHIVGDVVENYQRFANKKQAIVFADSIDTGTKMEKKFLEADISAKLLHGDTDDAVRFKSLQEFKEKRIQVLINVDLFDEGLDVPGIECVIMARPTMSLSKYLQMVGRGLRPVYAPGFDLSTAQGRLAAQKAGEKPYLILIDHVGNIKEHGAPDRHRIWTLDRIIKRREKINLTRICQNERCNAPFDRILSECPYCEMKVEPAGRSGGGGRISPAQVDGDLVMLDAETLRQMEANSILEDPGTVAQQVSYLGGPAAVKAMNAQRERIETQEELKKVIANWAGKMRQRGLSDRMINKEFYIRHEQTIWEAISKPRVEMLSLIAELNDLMRWG